LVTLTARFVPTANPHHWDVFLTFSFDGVVSERKGFVYGRPNLDALNDCMAGSSAGFVFRAEPDGSIDISTSGRATDVFRNWLETLVVYSSDIEESPTSQVVSSEQHSGRARVVSGFAAENPDGDSGPDLGSKSG
jgi:hypothetical protein